MKTPKPTVLLYTLLFTGILLTFTLAALVSIAMATGPTKFVLAYNLGKNVNKTLPETAPQSERNICTTTSKDECQPGQEGTEPLGFKYPESVAVNPQTGNVYIADKVNRRVQEITPQGKFILMFGAKVNTNGTNTCTQQEEAKCQAGEPGTGQPGQMSYESDVTVDPLTGNVYVLEPFLNRVEEFTPEGSFILMIGGKVNKTTGTNICTQQEIEHEKTECQTGEPGNSNGAFKFLFVTGYGNVMTVGPADHLLYVGDQGRMQKFEADGKWAGEISTTNLSPAAATTSVAVDDNNNVFTTVEGVAGVHEYDEAGTPQTCVIDPASPEIHGIAIDLYGRLGVIDYMSGYHASLYEAEGSKCGEPLAEIGPPGRAMRVSPRGLTFSLRTGASPEPEDQLYIPIASGAYEIESYVPVPFPEVLTCATEGSRDPQCEAQASKCPAETVTATTGSLCGLVNPNGQLTSAYFKYGTSETLLTNETAVGFGPSSEGEWQAFSLTLTGLIPNQRYYDQAYVQATVEGTLQTKGAPEIVAFHTTTPAPEITGTPTPSFITSQSAVLNSNINPEHAMTLYHFQYAQCERPEQTVEECQSPARTQDLTSTVYGTIETSQEITDLKPNSLYKYRLIADNHFEYNSKPEGGLTAGPEGELVTLPAPIPQAQIGVATNITATTATLTATVNPEGQAATTNFEITPTNTTQYTTLPANQVSSATTPTTETFTVNGLQPGTTYTYRIKIQNGYGQTTSTTTTFTTLPTLAEPPPPAVPTILPIPPIKFPAIPHPNPQPKRTCAHKHAKHTTCKTNRRAHKTSRRKHKTGTQSRKRA